MNQDKNLLSQQLNPNDCRRPYGKNDEAFPQETMAWGPHPGIVDVGMATSMAVTGPRDPGPSILTGKNSLVNTAFNVRQNLGYSLPSDVMLNGELAFQGVGLPPQSMLMNLDIPSSNFMKTINFENLSDDSSHERRIKGDVGSDVDVDEDLETGAHEDLESGRIPEQELDISADLAEQQQAREQAQLLQRFKELQRWQQQQQELLLLQQQQQLEALREEQAKVHFMIARQREMTWGAAEPSKNGIMNGLIPPLLPTTPSLGTSEKNNPTRNAPVRTQGGSTIPQALAQGSLALAKIQQRHGGLLAPSAGIQVNNLPPLNSTTTATSTASNACNIGVPNGRPLPNFRERASTPVEYRENGNPHLDSDSNTIDSMSNITDEGVFPLPDTASDVGVYIPLVQPAGNLQKKTLPHLGPSKNIRNAENRIPFEDNLTQVTIGKAKPLQTVQNGANVVKGHECEGNLNNNHNGEEVSFQKDQYDSEDLRDVEIFPYQDTHGKKSTLDNKPLEKRTSLGHHQNFDMMDDDDGDAISSSGPYEDDGVEEEIIDEQVSSTPKSFDDQPVSGIAGKRKTFEELLEEELAKEEERLVKEKNPEGTTLNGGKKTFLRKGQGVARFGHGASKNKKVGEPVCITKDRKPSTNLSVTSKNINDNTTKSRPLTRTANCAPPKVAVKKPLGLQKPSLPVQQQASKPAKPGPLPKSHQKSNVSPPATCNGSHRVPPSKKKKVPTATLR